MPGPSTVEKVAIDANRVRPCLAQLEAAERALILAYYAPGDSGLYRSRRRQAADGGMTLAALHDSALKVRGRIEAALELPPDDPLAAAHSTFVDGTEGVRITDSALRDFLLHRLPQAEMDAVATSLAQEPALGRHLRHLCSEVIDAYVLEDMHPMDRSAVRLYLLQGAGSEARLDLIRTLAEEAKRNPQRGNVPWVVRLLDKLSDSNRYLSAITALCFVGLALAMVAIVPKKMFQSGDSAGSSPAASRTYLIELWGNASTRIPAGTTLVRLSAPVPGGVDGGDFTLQILDAQGEQRLSIPALRVQHVAQRNFVEATVAAEKLPMGALRVRLVQPSGPSAAPVGEWLLKLEGLPGIPVSPLPGQFR